MGLTPHISNGDHKKIASTEFTKDVWNELNLPAIHLRDSLLETTRFRSGKTLPISSSADIYEALKATPLVSLYSMASSIIIMIVLTIFLFTMLQSKRFLKMFLKTIQKQTNTTGLM